MSGLPGLSLPGLTSSTPVSRPAAANLPSNLPPRVEEIPVRGELRFEVGFEKQYKVKLTRGTAEIFGNELALGVSYTFTGTKAAVFTWHGCTLEVVGDAESEYVGSETESMIEWVNLHGMLDTLRSSSPEGPRVLILGSDRSGKTSLVKCLTSWAIKTASSPTVLNLDSSCGLLAPPSSLTAVTYTSQLDPESSWGQSAISGPSPLTPRTPLMHHYPFASPLTNSPLYRSLTTRLALDATSKLESDTHLKRSGLLLDTPSSLARPEGYELVSHILSEFSINVVLTLGSERLYNDVSRRLVPAASNADDQIHVLRISPASGAVSVDESWRKRGREAQVRNYFFGDPRSGISLNPHSVTVGYGELAVWMAVTGAKGVSREFLPGGEDDDEGERNDGVSGSGRAGQVVGGFERVEPGQRLLNQVLAVKFAAAAASWEQVRDAAVMGFVYAAEIDEARKRVRFLAPGPGRWGDRVLVGGPWPEGVGDLVS